jgi:uncharacterized protein
MRQLLQHITGFIKAVLGISLGLFIVIVLYPSILPLSFPDESLSGFSPPPITDMHVHVAGIGYGDSGCFVGEELFSSYKKHIYLTAFGVSENELKTHGDRILVEKTSNMVSESRFVTSAVILALDGYHESDGTMNHKKTQIYVPNDYIQKETSRYDNLLYGASIHPYRKDAIEQLQKAKQNGAVLVKWIPSIMNIDPSDRRLIPFYEEMKRLQIPLLSHAGQEKSFAHADDRLCDPEKLTLPLDLGVTVIAAHIATTGTIDGEEMIDRLLPLFNRYSNLYADISSLTQINKLAYVDKGLLNGSIFNRVLYGSDWPLQFFPLVSAWYFPHKLSFWNMHYINSEANPLDRDILLKFALGVPEKVFENYHKILPADSVTNHQKMENLNEILF